VSFQALPWILENLQIGFLKAPISQIKIVKSGDVIYFYSTIKTCIYNILYIVVKLDLKNLYFKLDLS
jgi:hypothetical protein